MENNEYEVKVYDIEGAILMPEPVGGGYYVLPEMDDEFKYLIFTDKMSAEEGVVFPFVSKDLKNWVLPISVKIGGKERNPLDILKEIREGN